MARNPSGVPRDRESDAAVPVDVRERAGLAAWVQKQRHLHKRGEVSEARVASLKALPFRVVPCRGVLEVSSSSPNRDHPPSGHKKRAGQPVTDCHDPFREVVQPYWLNHPLCAKGDLNPHALYGH